MVNFADIANDMERNNVLNLGEMTNIEDIDAAVDEYAKDLFSESDISFILPKRNLDTPRPQVSLSNPPQIETKQTPQVVYDDHVNNTSAKSNELISMLLGLKPKFIAMDDEFVRVLSISKHVLSNGGKIKRGKPSSGRARRMFSGLFLYAAKDITPLSKAIYSLERMFANSGLYDLLADSSLPTLYIDDVDIITEKVSDPHFTNLSIHGIIFNVYYTSNGV